MVAPLLKRMSVLRAGTPQVSMTLCGPA